ncbi:MAG: glycosyltransferase [Glaciimonas sp.]|nr:glycosyltransferase [Glaciimonas sp.]
MSQMPIFLTLVISIRNQADQLQPLLVDVSRILGEFVSDYEIVIVDNASDDDSQLRLKALAGVDELPNLQIYALSKEVDADTAAWVGLENALGDFVAVIDPLIDDINFLPDMLDKAVSGADVVFANNEQKPAQSFAYRGAHAIFHALYKRLIGVHLAKEAPQYRVLSKRVVNFILQHQQPAMTYRHLPATGGFARVNLSYSAKPKTQHTKRLGESIDQGIRLLVSTTRAPMRLVTSLSVFGAVANLVYSIYVIVVAVFKADVAAGWVSLSLQQSGMFFLISMVLLVLGEYILNMVSLQNESPLYHVVQEFTSARMTRREKLNIEESMPQPKKSEAHTARVVR